MSLLVLIFLDQYVVQWRPGVHRPTTVPVLHSRHAGQHRHRRGHVGTAFFYLISGILCMGKGKSSVFKCFILLNNAEVQFVASNSEVTGCRGWFSVLASLMGVNIFKTHLQTCETFFHYFSGLRLHKTKSTVDQRPHLHLSNLD